MKPVVRWSVVSLAIVAALLVGWHRLAGHSLRDGLSATCSTIRRGDSLDAVLQLATNRGFEVRKSGSPGGNDWLDREYARVVQDHRKQLSQKVEIALAFAGSAADYFVCVMVHKDTRVVAAWFENHSR